MKRLAVFAVVLALFGAACDDDDNPNGPSDNNTIIFSANLLPANEVAPNQVTNAESSGSGAGTITFSVTRDASGNITAATANWLANLTGFPANTQITLAHIHRGVSGVSGGVVVNPNITPFTLTQGSGQLVQNNVTLTAAEITVLNEIIQTPSNFYYNVHSQLNPSGVARGQLVRQNP
jgi:CHRD domain